MSNIKILHISDTHMSHDFLELNTENVDILIHSGDCTQSKIIQKNQIEFNDFIEWFSAVDIKTKILVPGNHSIFISKFPDEAKRICKKNGITLLIGETVEVLGLKIFGCPYSLPFFNWKFMMVEKQLAERYDKLIESDTDIIVTHGPPFGIRDIAPEVYGSALPFRNCGSVALLNKTKELKNLKAVLFGHIHNNTMHKIENQGIDIIDDIIYSNGSCVTDGLYIYENGVSTHFKITSNGNEINV